MPDDPQASLRAELLGQVVGARFALEEALAELSRSGGNTAAVQNQMQALTQLQRGIGSASRSDLATMRSDIAAAVTQTHAVIEQGRASANVADAADGAALASRAQMQAASFMRDLHQYDDLLQFDNDAERDAYSQREDERRKRYEAGIAEGGPQGALTASGAAYGQAVDLAAHGGSANPALMRRVDDLAASTAALRAKIIQDGGDVSKFDEDMRADLRSIMRSKGIPDDRIDALLAVHKDNPINAMKAFVEQDRASLTDKELDAIKASVGKSASVATVPKEDVAEERSTSPTSSTAMADVIAKLRSSGVTDAAKVADATPVHGVTAQVAFVPVQGVSHS